MHRDVYKRQEKDWFMALLDVKDYIQTKEQMLKDYEDKNAWAKKMLVNIAKAGDVYKRQQGNLS